MKALSILFLSTCRICSVDSFCSSKRYESARSSATIANGLQLQQPQQHSQNPHSNPADETSQERRRQSLVVGNHPLLSLNLNLDALARGQAAERAQELYQRISALHQEGYYAVSPDVVSFNSVLKAWQSDPTKALDFWEQEERNLKDHPNIRSYNTILLALANAGMYRSAEELLAQMNSRDSVVVPDRISYNTLLLSYLVSDDAEEATVRAEARLNEMIEDESVLSLSTYVPTPDIVTFNTALAIFANHPSVDVAVETVEKWFSYARTYPSLQLDVCSYTTVMQAWGRAGRMRPELRNQSSQRIQELFQEMQSVGLQPNLITYTVFLQEVGKSQGAEAAHKLLDVMLTQTESQPNVRPDCVIFSALIDVYSKEASKNPESSVQACFAILAQMRDLAKKWPEVEPNERTYTSLLWALAKSRLPEAGENAEKVIDEMWETGLTPSSIHYNACIDAYAKSSRANKAIDAERIWNKMKEQGIQEDTITYNCLLSAVSGSYGSRHLKESSLAVGIKTFKALQGDPNCIPTSLSYHYWFKSIRKLVKREHPLRDAAVEQAFHLCCQQGCLNNKLLSYIMTHFDIKDKLISDPMLRLRTTNLSIDDVPTEWSSNALGLR